MRYLAIDLGEKRNGLAVGDDITGIVTPLDVIDSADPREQLRRIKQAIYDHAADALVLGYPLNMDGTVGKSAEQARRRADRMEQEIGLPVHLFDERLSSIEADDQMRERGLTHKAKKARRDALAAATILRDFFVWRRRP